MTSASSDATGSRAEAAHPSLPLGAYVEGLLRGRRVAIFGDATNPLVDQLFARGARLVHVYDPDPGRVSVACARRVEPSAAARGQRPVISLLGEDLGVRDGAFDAVLVPDISLFEDPQSIVRMARRSVSVGGVVVIGSPNPSAERFLLTPSGDVARRGLGYYELYDTVSLQFGEVKMLGQAPFVGYSIVDFSQGGGDVDVSVDTSCLEDPEAPEWYVAIASDRPVTVDPYTLVGIPLASVASQLRRSSAAPGYASSAPEDDDFSSERPTSGPPSLVESEAPTPPPPPAIVGFEDPPTLIGIPGVHGAEWARLPQPKIDPIGAPILPNEREVALAEARTRISVLLTENETLREELKERARTERTIDQLSMRVVELERDIGDERLRTGSLRDEVADHRTQLDQSVAERARLESELAAGREAWREAGLEAERAARVASLAAVEREKELEVALREARASVETSSTQVRQLQEALNATRARVTHLEVQLAGEPPTLRSKEQQQQRIAALESQKADLVEREQQLTRELAETRQQLAAEANDARERVIEVTAEKEAIARSHAELARQLEVITRSHDDLAKRLSKAESEATARLAERNALKAELARTTDAVREAERQQAAREIAAAAASAVAAATTALEQELRELELRLKERGHEVTRLQREIKEAERVGRELVFELEDARTAAAAKNGGGQHRGGGGGGSGSQLVIATDLAERAARAEADILASTWRISQLERELARRGPARDPSTVSSAERDLELALTAAQREIALLRGAGRETQEAASAAVPALEEALLLGQLQRERHESA